MKLRSALSALTLAAVLLVGCASGDGDGITVEPIAATTLDKVEGALQRAYPDTSFTTTSESQKVGADGICAFKSANRETAEALGSEALGGTEKLSSALTSGLSETNFTITEPLTEAPDGWLILTASDENGITFIFRAKESAEFYVTAEVNPASCASGS